MAAPMVKVLRRRIINTSAINNHSRYVSSAEHIWDSKLDHNKWPTKVISYRMFMNKRQNEASRSVLVKINNKHNVETVCRQLKDVGAVSNALLYKNILLVEFEKQDSVKKVLSNLGIAPPPSRPNLTTLPLESRLLMSADQDSNSKLYMKKGVNIQNEPNHQKLDAQKLNELKSVSEQVEFLHSTQKLSEFGLRYRFFASSVIEEFLSPTFYRCKIEPFGSCVNGFGSQTSDLDLGINTVSRKKKSGFNVEFMHSNEYNLGRIHKLLREFLPFLSNLYYVRHARVPIIKCNLGLLDVTCDLSDSNLSGSKMSELLYLYSQLDPRAPPLASIIKVWASHQGVTKSGPGSWPSNFMLLMMVIFFLQSKSTLPSISTMASALGKKNNVSPVDLSFSLTNIERFVSNDNRHQTLEELLVEFFQFYLKFDFKLKGFSLITGEQVDNVNNSAMYIENPFVIGHNIATNVKLRNLMIMKDRMESSLKDLESLDMGIIPLVCGEMNVKNRVKENVLNVASLYTTVSETESENSDSSNLTDEMCTDKVTNFDTNASDINTSTTESNLTKDKLLERNSV
ncbi:poly(A) RNA polymerase, mitochondrial isoform X1 [Patella vulgata]|uniref:poly(A) RNA polymerase, mitochondrial isoform X1 n=1 Tax=Patella vulgata TaxID=6465 RepID=UPI002180217E|nr:poly(A) RNA polymerase, mitochondrial isoform X1 [Patella vulgata]